MFISLNTGNMITHELTESIEIYKRVLSKNEYGENIETFVIYKSLKAKLVFKGGNENTIHNQLTPVLNVRFKIRYRRDIDETMFIKYRNDMYDIRYIEPIKRKDLYIDAERSKKWE